jgi:hypothetical protein
VAADDGLLGIALAAVRQLLALALDDFDALDDRSTMRSAMAALARSSADRRCRRASGGERRPHRRRHPRMSCEFSGCDSFEPSR